MQLRNTKLDKTAASFYYFIEFWDPKKDQIKNTEPNEGMIREWYVNDTRIRKYCLVYGYGCMGLKVNPLTTNIPLHIETN